MAHAHRGEVPGFDGLRELCRIPEHFYVSIYRSIYLSLLVLYIVYTSRCLFVWAGGVVWARFRHLKLFGRGCAPGVGVQVYHACCFGA